jgi:putative ABC transport system ATP-binding protein
MTTLAATDVTKSFAEGRQEIAVLQGVSLNVARGEIVALEGPSGSGKTTLLSILGCILTPTSGRVVVDGQRVDKLSAGRLAEVRKRSIGFVFQQYNLFPSLTARENVEYALNIKGMRGTAARKAAIEALEIVELGDRLDFLPRDLSGGQKQRVAIARAVASRPPILLADEPTANLDSQVGLQIMELFRNTAKQAEQGLVIVTHDPNVRRFADRVVRIRDGRLS